MILQFIFALLTTLVGQVYDEQTGAGLGNISVYIPNTPVGTATNENGYFYLKADLNKQAHITVSGIGYQTYRFTVSPGQTAAIDIGLKEKNTQLSDVFVRPGTNPALALMQRVRQARAVNDLPSSDNPDADTYLMISHIGAKQLKRQFWQQLQAGMIQTEDSVFFLPLYRSHRRQGKTESQAIMLSETDYQILLHDLDHPIDFYRNSIPVYSTSFLSPLASDGNNFYTYYLVDSTQCDTAKHYTVHFHTKNPYYNTFDGTMEIDSASAALVSIQASVPRQVNANYLHQLQIEQHFTPTHQLESEQVQLLLDFAIKADTNHIFPTVLVQNTKHYTLHPTPYTLHATPIDTAMQHLQSMPLIRTAEWIAYAVQNASFRTGTKIEFGNASEIIHLNPQEKVRIGIPIRTSPTLWRNVCLEGYAAYGVGDNAWKGAGTIYWNLPTQRRHMLTVRYADEYIYSEISGFDRLMRENAVWCPQMGITTALIKELYRGDNTYNSMVRQREGRIQWESDWSDLLETQIRVHVGRMGYGEPTHDYASQSSFFYSSMNALFRLSWQEKKVDRFCHRYHVYSNLPVLYLGGELGSYRLDHRDQYDLYGKLQLMLRHHQPLGAGGELDYLFEAGMIIGAVPYPLLNIFDGNQSYAYDLYRFTLMHNYQYAADSYMLLHADWNGQGCLFNLIPGIRVLRLRELVGFKIAYGTLSSRHAERLALPEGRLQDLSVPYVEVGVGIGNILRIADLMSVWRLTHRNEPGAPTWSLRFRFHIDT